MFDKLTSLYAALSPILGLEAVDELLAGIASERLGLENHAKQVKADAAALRGSLAEDEPRQAALAELLGLCPADASFAGDRRLRRRGSCTQRMPLPYVHHEVIQVLMHLW